MDTITKNESIKLQPYPYQEQGIANILSMRRCINGDDMGLGKTAQAIIAVERAAALPCLVICPASLKINWQREVCKFTNLRPLILTDAVKSTFPYFIGGKNTDATSLSLYDVVIVNYESLKKYFVIHEPRGAKLKDIIFQPVISQFRSVIIDESHRCKNPSTATAKHVMGICHAKEYVIALTGTPVINDPTDLATQLCILSRIKEFGGYTRFMNTYGAASDGSPVGRAALSDLNLRLLASCYFRRSKTEVLTDLPELTRTRIIVPLSNRDEYDLCEQDLRSWLHEYRELSDNEIRRKMRMRALVQFMNLRRIAGQGKVEAAVQFINDSSQPIVVFAEHHDIVDALLEAFPDAVCVTGRQNATQKQQAIDAFQAGRAKVIICSIRAAGVGLTLTAASNVLFVNLPWTMADLAQCEARCHRNGQRNAVNSWVLVGEDTIDSYLYHLILQKGSVAATITGAADEAIHDERYFDQLTDLFFSKKPLQ